MFPLERTLLIDTSSGGRGDRPPRWWGLRQGGRRPSILLASRPPPDCPLTALVPVLSTHHTNLCCRASSSVCTELFISFRTVTLWV